LTDDRHDAQRHELAAESLHGLDLLISLATPPQPGGSLAVDDRRGGGADLLGQYGAGVLLTLVIRLCWRRGKDLEEP
jgi:hypothetical protein